MKTLRRFASYLMLATPILTADTANIPWGMSERNGLTVVALPQHMPPVALLPPLLESPTPKQGFMLTLSSTRVAADAAAGIKVTFKVYVTAILKSGQYLFEYKEVKYNSEHATTVFFPIGPTSAIAALRIEETREYDMSKPID